MVGEDGDVRHVVGGGQMFVEVEGTGLVIVEVSDRGVVNTSIASEGIISVVGEDGDIRHVVGSGYIFVGVVGASFVVVEVTFRAAVITGSAFMFSGEYCTIFGKAKGDGVISHVVVEVRDTVVVVGVVEGFFIFDEGMGTDHEVGEGKSFICVIVEVVGVGLVIVDVDLVVFEVLDRRSMLGTLRIGLVFAEVFDTGCVLVEVENAVAVMRGFISMFSPCKNIVLSKVGEEFSPEVGEAVGRKVVLIGLGVSKSPPSVEDSDTNGKLGCDIFASGSGFAILKRFKISVVKSVGYVDF